jgi:hypothetical protein
MQQAGAQACAAAASINQSMLWMLSSEVGHSLAGRALLLPILARFAEVWQATTRGQWCCGRCLKQGRRWGHWLLDAVQLHTCLQVNKP